MLRTTNEKYGIDLEKTSEWTTDHPHHASKELGPGYYFGKTMIESIITLKGCVGIRVSDAIDENRTRQFMLTGIDKDGNELRSELAARNVNINSDAVKEPIKIAMAENCLLGREGIIRLLKDYQDLEFVFCASNGRELIDWLDNNTPDIILLNLNMPIMNGREAFSRIISKNGNLKIIIFTEDFTDHYVTEFMKKGARAFLSKNNRIEKVADTIRRVHTNGVCIDTLVSNILTKKEVIVVPDFPGQDRPHLKLSTKEIVILRYMCQGRETKEIANLMHCAIKTIENHRCNIWRKSGCETIPDLMDFAFKNSLIAF